MGCPWLLPRPGLLSTSRAAPGPAEQQGGSRTRAGQGRAQLPKDTQLGWM